MDKEERYREVEKRERLVQTFLIISGFLVGFTREKFQPFIVLIFSMYLIYTILYYIFLSRTRNYLVTDYLAFLSSIFYSLLILTFVDLQLTKGFSSWHFWFLFLALTGIFTFALLSPESSENIVNQFEKFLKKQEEKHPKLLKVTLVILVIIPIIIVVWTMYHYLTRL